MRTLLLSLLLLLPLAAHAKGKAKPMAPDAPVVVVPAAATGTASAVTQPAAPVLTLQAEPTPASIRVAAKDPADALRAALWPGILLHGWGHHVAGDQDTFLNLAGGELFSAVMLGFGLAEALGPDIKDESKATSQSIAVAGAVVFGVTWLWDIAGAKAAARRYNAQLSLSLLPKDDGAQVALVTRF